MGLEMIEEFLKGFGSPDPDASLLERLAYEFACGLSAIISFLKGGIGGCITGISKIIDGLRPKVDVWWLPKEAGGGLERVAHILEGVEALLDELKIGEPEVKPKKLPVVDRDAGRPKPLPVVPR